MSQLEHFKVKSHTKYKPPNTAYCNSWSCLCEVQLRDDGRCPNCFQVPARKVQNYEPARRRFEVILKLNKPYLNGHVFDSWEQESLKIPVQIGHSFYAVPLRYFVEFENLTDRRLHPQFFEMIVSVCKRLKL